VQKKGIVGRSRPRFGHPDKRTRNKVPGRWGVNYSPKSSRGEIGNSGPKGTTSNVKVLIGGTIGSRFRETEGGWKVEGRPSLVG